jgi:hypothetical protein
MGRSYELQLETVRDGKLFVNPLHLPAEKVRLTEDEDSLQAVLNKHR